MTRFLSQRPNVDPEPWACYTTVTRDDGETWEAVETGRHAEYHEGQVYWEPRERPASAPSTTTRTTRTRGWTRAVTAVPSNSTATRAGHPAATSTTRQSIRSWRRFGRTATARMSEWPRGSS